MNKTEQIQKLKGLHSLLTDYDRLYSLEQEYVKEKSKTANENVPVKPEPPEYEKPVEYPVPAPFKDGTPWGTAIFLVCLILAISVYGIYTLHNDIFVYIDIATAVITLIWCIVSKKASNKAYESYQKTVATQKSEVDQQNAEIDQRNDALEKEYNENLTKYDQRVKEIEGNERLINMRIETIESTLTKLEQKFQKEYTGLLPNNDVLYQPDNILKIIDVLQHNPEDSLQQACQYVIENAEAQSSTSNNKR